MMADQYANFLSLFVIEGYEQRNVNSQLEGFFNNYHYQTIISKHKSEKRILWFKGLIIIGLLLFVVIPFLVYIQKRNRMKAVSEVGNKLIQNQLQYTALISRLLKKNSKLSENRQTHAPKKESPSFQYMKKPSIDDYNELVNEPICRKIVNRFTDNDIITSNKSSYYKDLSATEKDLKRLDKVIEKYCPDFINRVYGAHPCLENGELEMCKFFLIGLNEKQIAVLLQKNYSTFYRYSSSFKEKTSCTDIKEHLKTILFERNNDILQEKAQKKNLLEISDYQDIN